MACVYLLAFIACVARVSAGLGGPCQFDLGPVFRRKTQDSPFGQTSLYPWVFFEMPGSSNSGLWAALSRSIGHPWRLRPSKTRSHRFVACVGLPEELALPKFTFALPKLTWGPPESSWAAVVKWLPKSKRRRFVANAWLVFVWMACGRFLGFSIL